MVLRQCIHAIIFSFLSSYGIEQWIWGSKKNYMRVPKHRCLYIHLWMAKVTVRWQSELKYTNQIHDLSDYCFTKLLMIS